MKTQSCSEARYLWRRVILTGEPLIMPIVIDEIIIVGTKNEEWHFRAT